MRPRALDLFCGAGGVSVGLERAGFDVTGVDINPQPRYRGGVFVQADALTFPLDGYDFIWASPPCQRFSVVSRTTGAQRRHPDLVEPIRRLLRDSGAVYAIENVPGAPLLAPVVLCGAAFHLGAMGPDGVYRPLKRHRLVECSWDARTPGCACAFDGRKTVSVHGGSHRRQCVGVYGHGGQGNRSKGARGGYQASAPEAREALGIDWMTRDELARAIPPSYAWFIGQQAFRQVLRSLYKNRRP